MGFFSKVFKSVGKVFKKIGKGIKSAFKKFGKFMNKIGVLGQVAMFFIMPYVGAALGGMFTGAAGALATNTVGGALGAAGQAAGKLMQFVGNTVSKGFNVYSNITKGVTDTLGNFAKTASNKMFGTTFEASANFFGPGDSAFSRSFGGESRFQRLTTSDNIFKAESDARKIEFNKSQLSKLDEVVAESAGDDRFGFGSDYANNIQRQIDIGESNLIASTNPNYVPDPAAFESGYNISPDFKAPIIENPTVVQNPSLLGTPRNMELAETLRNVDPTNAYTTVATEYDPSLFERLKTGISDAPANIYKKAGEIADDPLGYAFKGTEESIQQQVNLRVGQELGISEKPVYTQNYVSNNAYVPSFESFGGSQQQYGAQEIMNARAFEQQVSNNPSPYGYTAFQYGNYMAQSAQTA